MSILLLLIGLVIFIVGLPFLAAAFGLIVWALHRMVAYVMPSRATQRPAA